MTFLVPALRFIAVAAFQPLLGGMAFLLIFRLTGGQWGERLEQPLCRAARRVTWMWPLLALISLLPHARPTLPLPEHAAALPSNLVLGIRAIFYEAILLLLRWIAVAPRGTRWAPPGLLLLIFMGHFMAADQFFVIEPGWYSSGFPLVWLAVCAASGIALAIVTAVRAGADPAEPGGSDRPVGLDWGNLLLTAVVFATYVSFMEFLIIWSGDLPREIGFYRHRSTPLWIAVLLTLAALHLAFPFVMLLSRRLKQGPGLPRVAYSVLGAGVLWALWLTMPPFTAMIP